MPASYMQWEQYLKDILKKVNTQLVALENEPETWQITYQNVMELTHDEGLTDREKVYDLAGRISKALNMMRYTVQALESLSDKIYLEIQSVMYYSRRGELPDNLPSVQASNYRYLREVTERGMRILPQLPQYVQELNLMKQQILGIRAFKELAAVFDEAIESFNILIRELDQISPASEHFNEANEVVSELLPHLDDDFINAGFDGSDFLYLTQAQIQSITGILENYNVKVVNAGHLYELLNVTTDDTTPEDYEFNLEYFDTDVHEIPYQLHVQLSGTGNQSDERVRLKVWVQ